MSIYFLALCAIVCDASVLNTLPSALKRWQESAGGRIHHRPDKNEKLEMREEETALEEQPELVEKASHQFPRDVILTDQTRKHPQGYERTSTVSSWVLFHSLGDHTKSLQEPELGKLSRALRDAIADWLEVCRASVRIKQIKGVNIDLVDPQVPGNAMSTLAEGIIGAVSGGNEDKRPGMFYSNHLNLTQLKAWYEVRIFDEMRLGQTQVVQRVDGFQVFGKFSEVERLLAKSFHRTSPHGMWGIVLDDVGYPSRDMPWKRPVTAGEVMDCAEEMLLHDARRFHQYVMVFSLMVAAFIFCAGSTIFTVKHPSIVPSRFNQLGIPDSLVPDGM